MSKQQLSQMINNLINDKPEQASTALHDYLAAKMQEVAGIKENYGSHDDKDLGELVDAYLDQEGIHSFESDRGVRSLGNLFRALDGKYSDIRDFLADNSGACEAIVEWIKSTNVQEWKENLESVVGSGDDQEDEDEDFR